MVDDEAELDAIKPPSLAATPNQRGSGRMATRRSMSVQSNLLGQGKTLASHVNELGISGVETVEDLRREALNRIEVALCGSDPALPGIPWHARLRRPCHLCRVEYILTLGSRLTVAGTEGSAVEWRHGSSPGARPRRTVGCSHSFEPLSSHPPA